MKKIAASLAGCSGADCKVCDRKSRLWSRLCAVKLVCMPFVREECTSLKRTLRWLWSRWWRRIVMQIPPWRSCGSKEWASLLLYCFTYECISTFYELFCCDLGMNEELAWRWRGSSTYCYFYKCSENVNSSMIVLFIEIMFLYTEHTHSSFIGPFSNHSFIIKSVFIQLVHFPSPFIQ